MGGRAKRMLALAGGLAPLLLGAASAFAPAPPARPGFGAAGPSSRTATGPLPSLPASPAAAAAAPSAEVSGAPSREARRIDIRAALSRATVRRLDEDGSPVSVSDLLGDDDGGPSLIVLTRSFGWPFCQEQILQYAERRGELLANGVRFALVSIGTPEVGRKLCDHLGVNDGTGWIYADPENDAYDRLMLNRGWDTMAKPATAFRFRDRIFRGRGRDEFSRLFEVLGKWKDAVYVPPRVEQATNHGGTFLFDGDNVAFAHYDASPGTHADTYDVVDRAIRLGKNAASRP